MNDSVTALFAGPDDRETCDEGGPDDTGCDGAVNGGPYTLATVPLPGSFRCQTNCRHFIQLDGDAPEGVETIDWNNRLGFIYSDDEDNVDQPDETDESLDDLLAEEPDAESITSYIDKYGIDAVKDQADAGFDETDSETAQALADSLDEAEPDENWHTEVRADGRWYVVNSDTQTLQESLREGGIGSGDFNHPGDPGHVGGSSSDYGGNHRPMTADGGAAALHEIDKAIPDIYSKEALHYYGEGDAPLDRKTLAILRSVRGKPDAPVMIYRAVPKGVAAQINPKDWVTINKQYAINHGESTLLGSYQIAMKQVKARELFGNGDSIHEQGYFPLTGEVPPMLETIKLTSKKLKLREGGAGSGNHAHGGRPGQVGGSAPDSNAWAIGDGPSIDQLDKVSPHIYSKDALKHYGTGNDTLDHKTLAILHSVRGNPDASVTVYRAVSKADLDPTIHNLDYVSVNKQYAINQAKLKFTDGHFQIVGMTIPARDLYANPKSIQQQKVFSQNGEGAIDIRHGKHVEYIEGEYEDITHLRIPKLPDIPIVESSSNGKLKLREGGAGSGNYGHAGRPGEVGGSSSGDSHSDIAKTVIAGAEAVAGAATTVGGVIAAKVIVGGALAAAAARDRKESDKKYQKDREQWQRDIAERERMRAARDGVNYKPYEGFSAEGFPIIEAARGAKLKLREGGEGSGNHGHAGRPGEVGGSASGGSTEDDAWAIADGASVDQLDKVMPRIYSAQALQHYGTGHDHLDQQTLAILHGLRGKPDASVTIYHTVPIHTPREAQRIHSMDYVSVNKNYAMNQGREKYGGEFLLLSRVVKAADLYGSPKSIHVQKWLSPEGFGVVSKHNAKDYIEGEWEDITHVRLPPIVESVCNGKLKLREGGIGSGFEGHAGIPGHVGGSVARDGGGGAGTDLYLPVDTSSGNWDRAIKTITDRPGKHEYDVDKTGNGFPLEVNGFDYGGIAEFSDKVKAQIDSVKRSILDAIVRNATTNSAIPRLADVFFAKAWKHEGHLKLEAARSLAMTFANSPLGAVVGFELKKIGWNPTRKADNYAVYSRATNSIDYARLITDHEMGHVLFNTMSRQEKGAWYNIWRESQQLEFFSPYSHTDSSEAFAEAYTSYVNALEEEKPGYEEQTGPSRYKLPERYKRFMEAHNVTRFSASDRYTQYGSSDFRAKPIDASPRLPFMLESNVDDTHYELPEQPVAIFCGDPNGPFYLYADGRCEQKMIPAKFKLAESMREVGGPGSGDWNHPGDPGYVGGSLPGPGGGDPDHDPNYDPPIDTTITRWLPYVKKITDRPGTHSYRLSNNPNGDSLDVQGFDYVGLAHGAASVRERMLKLKETILDAVVRNIESVPMLPRMLENVVFAKGMSRGTPGYPTFKDYAKVGAFHIPYHSNGVWRATGGVLGFDLRKIGATPVIPHNYAVYSRATNTVDFAKLMADHMMGHVMYHSMSRDDQAEWNRMFQRAQQTRAEFSRYANVGPLEAFAEAYAAHVNRLVDYMPFQYNAFLIGRGVPRLMLEADVADAELPVATFCGDPNGPIYVYADGRSEQLTTGRPSEGFWATLPDTDPNKLKLGESQVREGGPGSGYEGHPGNPGHVGGSVSRGDSSLMPGSGGDPRPRDGGGQRSSFGGVQRKLLTATDGVIHGVMSAPFDKLPYEKQLTKYDDIVKFHLAHAPEDSVIYANALQRNMAIPEQVKRIDTLIFAHALQQFGDPLFDQFAGLTLDYVYGTRGLVAVAFNPHTYNPANNGDSHSLPRRFSADKESYTRLVVAHEMGHVFYNAMASADKSNWHDLYWNVVAKQPQKLYEWSNYGSSSPTEAFAEAYVAYTHKLHLPLPFNNFMAARLHGNRLVDTSKPLPIEPPPKLPFMESDRSVTDEKPDDVMFTTCGFDAFPSYQWLRDGTKVLIFDPANPEAFKPKTKLKLGESKLKLVEANPNQARDDAGRWTSSGGVATTIAQRTLAGQGGSFSTHGEAPPKTGYMVSDAGHERIVTVSHATMPISVGAVEAAIRSYIADYHGPLLRKGVYLGTWLEHGQLFLDNSHNIQNRQEAFLHAHSNNQFAVYNLDTGKGENTMTDGLRPKDSVGKLNDAPDVLIEAKYHNHSLLEQEQDASSPQVPTHKVFSNPATLDPHALAEKLVEEYNSRGNSTDDTNT